MHDGRDPPRHFLPAARASWSRNKLFTALAPQPSRIRNQCLSIAELEKPPIELCVWSLHAEADVSNVRGFDGGAGCKGGIGVGHRRQSESGACGIQIRSQFEDVEGLDESA